MIIAISGLHGTGKSTIGKKLAEHYGLKYYSTGFAFRELASDNGMNLEQFTTYVEDHPEIDKELDDRIVKIAKEDNIVIESQLSGYLLKTLTNIRVLLTSSLEVRVNRMAERDGSNHDQKLKETKMREISELNRFKELYNLDLSDDNTRKEIFNIIINTDNLSIEEVFQTAVERIDTLHL